MAWRNIDKESSVFALFYSDQLFCYCFYVGGIGKIRIDIPAIPYERVLPMDLPVEIAVFWARL